MSNLNRIVRHTAFTGIAFLAMAFVGLLLVPVLVGAYGVGVFGLLVIVRALMPSGVLGLMDFGVGESAMLSVARARSHGDWHATSEQLTLLLVISLIPGALLAATLFAFAPSLVRLFAVDSPAAPPFVEMVRVTAAALAVLFPALIVEGVVKGFERFGLLRLCEAAATLVYGLLVVSLVWSEHPFETIQYAFLAATATKYAALAAGIAGDAKRVGIRPAAWSRDTMRHVGLRSTLLLQAKFLGTLQGSVPQLLVGAIVGPGGAGVYDIITRLPRALKPMLSVMVSVIAPTGARLQGARDTTRLRELGKAGIWLVPFVALPLLTGMAVHAEFILAVWIGLEYARYAPWLAVAFITPTLFIALQFGQNALQADPEFVRAANRLAAIGVAVQFGLSLSLVHWLGEFAFVLGQAIGVGTVFPGQLRLLSIRFGLTTRWVSTQLLNVAAPAIALAPISLAVQKCTDLSVVGHVVAFALWCATCWFGGYWLILREDQRRLLRMVFVAASKGTVR